MQHGPTKQKIINQVS